MVGEETYHRVDISNKELNEFFESMSPDQFMKVNNLDNKFDNKVKVETIDDTIV